MSDGKKAVLLLQMGGPQSLADIRPFLYNLFCDRLIVPLPGPAPVRRALAGIISTLRSRWVAERYRAIGGGSPLVRLTAAQARALEAWLAGHGSPAPVRPVMRYCPPRSFEVAREMAEQGVTRCLALSLYPHYSVTTTGSSLADLREAFDRMGSVELAVIDRWGNHPGYIDLLSRWVRREAEILAGETDGNLRIIFSAHGLPERLILEGDPYAREVADTVAGVEKNTGLACEVSYQSRIGPVKWIGPSTGEVLEDAARRKVRGVLLVPVSFVSDHIETLYDLDIVYKNRARALGIPIYRRLRAFNDDPAFIEVLGSLVSGAADRYKAVP